MMCREYCVVISEQISYSVWCMAHHGSLFGGDPVFDERSDEVEGSRGAPRSAALLRPLGVVHVQAYGVHALGGG